MQKYATIGRNKACLLKYVESSERYFPRMHMITSTYMYHFRSIFVVFKKATIPIWHVLNKITPSNVYTSLEDKFNSEIFQFGLYTDKQTLFLSQVLQGYMQEIYRC